VAQVPSAPFFTGAGYALRLFFARGFFAGSVHCFSRPQGWAVFDHHKKSLTSLAEWESFG
jgi:hypothetical protein